MPEAYDRLEATVRSRTLEGYKRGKPFIVLYFDESHSLTRGGKYTTRPNAPSGSLDSAQKGPPNSGDDVYPTPYICRHAFSHIASSRNLLLYALYLDPHTSLHIGLATKDQAARSNPSPIHENAIRLSSDLPGCPV